MLRRTAISTITAVFLIFIAIISPIIPRINRRRRKNAPETSSAMEHHPYKIPRKELENPKGFEDYSFNRIIRDNFGGKAASERKNRSREEDEEINGTLWEIARSMHGEVISLMDEMKAHEELMSREGNEDTFFNHRRITPRIIESKIVTRNVNVHYIGRKPMINRPVAHKTPPEGGFLTPQGVYFLVCTIGRGPKTVVR